MVFYGIKLHILIFNFIIIMIFILSQISQVFFWFFKIKNISFPKELIGFFIIPLIY